MENLGSIILATRDRILQLVDFVFAQKIDEEVPHGTLMRMSLFMR